MDTVTLNLRGKRFEVTPDLLRAIPYTTLARLDKSSEYYNVDKDEYFFNRDPEVFNVILNYLVLKELHIPRHICGGIIRQEFKFWRIQEQNISQCCWHTFYSYHEDKSIFEKLENLMITDETKEHHEKFCDGGIRMTLWKTLTEPSHSIVAMIWHYFFLLVVFMSSVVFCLWTLPDFRVPPYLYEPPPMPPPDPNSTSILNEKLLHLVIFDAIPEIIILEGICLFIFTFELFLNFILCPDKTKFFKDSLNIIHIVVFVIMGGAYSMEFLKGQMAGKPALGYVYFVVKGLNMVRIFLFIRFERTFQAFRVLLLALRASVKELCLMFLGFAVLTMFFSSVIFYLEIYGDTFYNIFICMWWAIITMTTVGYGDVSPTTTAGYIIGVLCATSGILLISMPVAVIASNFSSYYLVHHDITMHKESVARGAKKSCLEKLVRNLHGQTLNCMQLLPNATETSSDENKKPKDESESKEIRKQANGSAKPPLPEH